MWRRSRKGKKMNLLVLIAIGFLVVILGMIVAMMLQNAMVPEGLGVKDGRLAPMPSSPNAVSSQSEDLAYKVEPLKMKDTIQRTKDAFIEACDIYGNYEIISEDDHYMHLVFTTSTMGYKDDVEIYIDETTGLVHYRSASRVGYSDMGLNRERYNALKDNY